MRNIGLPYLRAFKFLHFFVTLLGFFAIECSVNAETVRLYDQSKAGFTPQLGDFTGIGLANDIAGLHELLGPFVIQALGNAFAAAQLGNTVFTA